MKSFSSYVSGFVVGAAIASVVTMLTTTRTGEEMRSFLRSKGMEYRDMAEEKLNEGQRVVSKTLAKASDKVAERMEEGSDKLKEVSGNISQNMQDGSDKMKQKADDMRQTGQIAEKTTSPSQYTYKPPTA